MVVGSHVEVLGVPCRVLRFPLPAEVAHPGEGHGPDFICYSCCEVAHPVSGQPVLAWGFASTGDFSVSRSNPDHEALVRSWPTKFDTYQRRV